MFSDFSASKLTPFFFNDFLTCRESFLEIVNLVEQSSEYGIDKKQWTLNHSIAGLSDNLSSDAVFIGNRQAKKVLVLISGTHGVEGYCGSAIQRFLLSGLAQKKIKLPQDSAIIMIHALNPWGMYWARRCDHEGIDVNRNFVDFSAPLTTHIDYGKVLDFLGSNNLKIRQEKMQSLVALWGQTHFDEVFSGGQYHHDWAPFYGGQQASFSQSVIEDVIKDWALSEREVIVLDLHTGLGPWSYGEIISDHPLNSSANHFAQKLFGEAVAVTEKGESFSVKKAGLLDYRWHKIMQSSGCFLTLEFGTYGTDSLFHSLLNEHLFWRDFAPSSLEDLAYQSQRLAMMQHFFPEDSLWRQATLFKAWQTVQRVLDYYS